MLIKEEVFFVVKKLADDDLEKNKEAIKKEIISDVKKEINEVKKTLKSDIVKEIRFEATTTVKDDIKQQLILDVNNEIKDNIRKEQKQIIRSKNIKLFKKNVFILILIGLVVYFGYCLWDARYFDFMKDKTTTTTSKKTAPKDTTTKEDVIIKDKAWYIENYGYLLDTTKLDLSMDNPNVYYLYTGNYDKSSMKDTIKLNLAYKYVENKKETDYNYTISENDMKDAYAKVFGSNDNYNPSSFVVGCMQFYYNSADKTYSAYKFTCDTSNPLHIKEEIKDMYEEGDKIIIETVMGVYNENNKYLFNYTNLYSSVATDFDENKSTLDYETSLSTYKYTFSKIKDKYYFESIEKTK